MFALFLITALIIGLLVTVAGAYVFFTSEHKIIGGVLAAAGVLFILLAVGSVAAVLYFGI